MAEVIELLTKLRMDASEFNEKITQAKEQVQEFSKESTSAMSAFGFGLTTVATVALTYFGMKVGEAADQINKLYETSIKVGVGVTSLNELQNAMGAFGVTGDSVVRMLGFMEKSIGQAKMGTGQAADAFKALKLDLDDLSKMKPEEQFMAVAKALGGIKDLDVQAALAKTIAGRGGALDLLGAVRSGKLTETLDAYKGTGVDEESAAKIHEFIEQINLASAQAKKVSYDIMASVVTWVQYLGQAIHTIAGELQKAFNFVKEDVQGLAASAGRGIASATGLGEWHDNRSLLEVFLEKHAPSWLSDQSNFGKLLGMDEKTVSDQNITGGIKSLFGIKDAKPIDKAKESLDKLAASADDAAYNLKDVSKISELIKNLDKKNTDDALKDLLGNSLTGDKPVMNLKNLSKPFESFEVWAKEQEAKGFSTVTNAGYIQAKAEHDIEQDADLSNYQSFQEQFQRVFQDAKKYGLKGHPITGGIGGSETVQDEINDLKQSAKGLGTGTGFDTSGIVGAVNDLQKFASEQKNKDNKVEMTVKLDKGLIADAKSADGVKITIVNDAISSAFATAASSMGK